MGDPPPPVAHPRLLFSSADPFVGLPPRKDTEDPATCTRCVHEAFARWQPHAWKVAKWLFGLAVGLFTTAVVAGIVEEKDALWKGTLAVCCFLMVSAAICLVFACRHTDCGARGEQRQDNSQRETPTNVAAFA